MWCKVVNAIQATQMNDKRSQARSQKAQRETAVRASISFPPDLYQVLERIARQKKVSLAWIVRDAVEKYVGEESAEAPRTRSAKGR